MTDTVNVHMRETDAFSWTMERDPVLRMTVVALALLDGVPNWDEVTRRMERLTRVVPMFRQRVVPTPAGLAPPKWVVDDRFDLSWHVHRVAVPEPGDVDALLDLAARIGTAGFDLERPLWELWFVEGLAGGGAAWLAKVHHTMTDGVGGMQLLAHVFDVDGTPLATTAGELPPPPGDVGPRALLRSALAHNAWQGYTAVRAGVEASARTLAATRHGPRSALGGAAATWRTLFESVAPGNETLSPVMTARGIRRRYAMLEVPVDRLRAAGHEIDAGTVNDAFLTAVTGGLRRYHEQLGAVVPELRLTLPINIRQPGDATAGNRIALIRLLVPITPADPRARMQDIHRRAEYWKRAPGLAYTEAAYFIVNYLPTTYLQGLAKHVDFVASNVPGFSVPVQLAGPRVRALYAFGPAAGPAVNVTMLSYDGTAHVGINVDLDAVTEFDTFVRCLREGFDEVVAAAAEETTRATPA
jgi:diacylglycerol O-acyltransferase